MKNILFISYDGMTDPLGQSQVIPYLAGLTKFDYKFTILSCEKPERFRTSKNYVEDLLKNYSIKWVPIPYHKKPKVLSSVYDVMMLKRKARQLHYKEKFDMVHTRSGIPSLIGLWMKKKFEVKFLNDIREFYADSRIDGGMWNLNNFFYKRIYNFFKRKEVDEVKSSDAIVCLTYAAQKIIQQWPQYKKEISLTVIPCSVDMNLFNPANINDGLKNQLRSELKINDNDFILSYLGSTGGWYLNAEMFQFCKKIIDKIPSAKILFISPQNHSEIRLEAEKFGIASDKIIVRHGKRHEVPALLSLSNYSIFFIKPCYSKLSSSPTKHGEIMAMGIPVISNSGVGDVKEIIEKYQSGFVINEFSNLEYEKCIASVKENKFDNSKIRSGASDYYSLDDAIKKYSSVYKNILG